MTKLKEEFGFGGLTALAAEAIPEEEVSPPTSCEFYDASGFCKVNGHLCPHFECTFMKCVVREHALMLQRGDFSVGVRGK